MPQGMFFKSNVMRLGEMLQFAATLAQDEKSTCEQLSVQTGRSKSYVSESRRLYARLHQDIQKQIISGELVLSVSQAITLSKYSLDAQLENLSKFVQRSRVRAIESEQRERELTERIQYLRTNPRVITPGAIDIVSEVLDWVEGKTTETRFINSKFGQAS